MRDVLLTVPWWYWLGGAWCLLAFLADVSENKFTSSLRLIWDIVVAFAAAFWTFMIAVGAVGLMVLFWPAVVVWRTVTRNQLHIKNGQRVTPIQHKSVEWFRKHWIDLAPNRRGLFKVGNYLVIINVFQTPDVSLFEFVPAKASIFGSNSYMLNFILFEVSLCRYPFTDTPA